MTRIMVCFAALSLAVVPAAWAQAAAGSNAQAPAAKPVAETTAPPAAAASPYAGSWTEWPKGSGDWWGTRTALADKGISIDLGITQIIQSNTYGGLSTDNGTQYSGSADLQITLDTGKLTNGLWPGATIIATGEPRWENGVNSKVGLLPVNTDAAKSFSGETCQMTLSELFVMQALFEGKLILLAGKLDGSRAFDTNVFANNEKTQFMNIGLRNYPVIPGFLPYTTLGAGAIVNPTNWLSMKIAVADTDGHLDTSGFDTLLHGPTDLTVINEYDVAVKPFGLPGNQRVGMVWTCKDTPEIAGGMSPDNIGMYYNFDQYLFTQADDPTQGFGVFGRFGWARGNVNAIEYFYSAGLGGKGLIPTRSQDTWGVGLFYADLSDYLPGAFNQTEGVELFYNVEVLRWLHLSPDLQFIGNPDGMNPGVPGAIVAGLRLQMDL